ncbi:MAG: aspartyl protease family protein [Bacteroidota bacterium]
MCLALPALGLAQHFALPEGQKVQKVRFELINNLVIIPMEVNGAKLSFILDSGVNKPLLFSLSDQDSIQLNNVSEITIKGLGEGEPLKALRSRGNIFQLKNIRNFNQQLYVVLDKSMNFSPTLGIPIHGIIGYDLFRDFVVDINYNTKVIKFYDPQHYKPKHSKKSQTLPISILKNKSYLQGKVALNGKKDIPVKLLVDTGSSDAVWLFKDTIRGIGIPDKYYDDFLGKGLNGDIFGKRTKLNNIAIGNFVLNDAKAAFPNMASFSAVKDLGDRNGSVGGEVLKRFNITFNYPKNEITLRKNGNFNKPFHYNMSGIELQHNGLRYIAERIADARGVVKNDEEAFGNVQILMENRTRVSLVPEIVVSGIRAGSPAAEAGLKEGDVVLAVNGRMVHEFKLQEIMKMINEREGKKIRLLSERYNKDLLFSFVLKEVFK